MTTLLAKLQLGDYVQIAVLCAIVLPLIATGLLACNAKWAQSAGKVIGGLGAVAIGLVGLAVLAVIAGSMLLAWQLSR